MDAWEICWWEIWPDGVIQDHGLWSWEEGLCRVSSGHAHSIHSNWEIRAAVWVGAGTGGGGECRYIGPYHPQTPTPAGKTQAKKLATFAAADAFWRNLQSKPLNKTFYCVFCTVFCLVWSQKPAEYACTMDYHSCFCHRWIDIS